MKKIIAVAIGLMFACVMFSSCFRRNYVKGAAYKKHWELKMAGMSRW